MDSQHLGLIALASAIIGALAGYLFVRARSGRAFEPHFVMAQDHASEGHYAKALASYRRALNLVPKNSVFRVRIIINMIDTLLQLEQREEAQNYIMMVKRQLEGTTEKILLNKLAAQQEVLDGQPKD